MSTLNLSNGVKLNTDNIAFKTYSATITTDSIGRQEFGIPANRIINAYITSGVYLPFVRYLSSEKSLVYVVEAGSMKLQPNITVTVTVTYI
jgi:hypothetical protein